MRSRTVNIKKEIESESKRKDDTIPSDIEELMELFHIDSNRGRGRGRGTQAGQLERDRR